MDIEILLWLQYLRLALGTGVEKFFCLISAAAIHPLIMFIPGIIYWCLDKQKGYLMTSGFTSGSFIVQFLKCTFCTYRPWVRDPRIILSPGAAQGARGYSFPSGHTQMAASTFGAGGWMYRKKHKILAVLGWGFTGLVMFSRMYLGAHTPQDVLTGLAVSLVCMILSEKFLAWYKRSTNMLDEVMIAGFALGALSLVYITARAYPRDYVNGVLLVDPLEMQEDYFKSAGMAIGLLTGAFFEHRYLRFGTMNLTWKQRFARLLIGGACCGVMLVMSEALKPYLEPRWGGMLRYALLMYTMVFLGPLAFTALERKEENKKNS